MQLREENRLEILRSKAILLEHENVRLVSEVVRLRKEILALKNLPAEHLQQELSLLEAELQRARTELEKRIDSVESKSEPTEKPKQTGHGPKTQVELPIEVLVHTLEPAKPCELCGGSLEVWEGHEDETEEIEVIERHFILKKHVRPKYRCRCGCIEMAKAEPRVVPGGRYGNEMVLEIASMKYIDQIPYDRISRIFGREGVSIDSQTLWDQVNAFAFILEPSWERLRKEALKEAVIGLDQTHWKVLGHKKSWQMWELSTPEIAHFSILETKGTEDGLKILSEYSGIVLCDAFSTHGALSKKTSLTLSHCWAHPMREAKACKTTDPMRSEVLIEFIRELYAIEDASLGDFEKLRHLRDTQSRDVLKRLWEWLDLQRVLPSTPMGKLISYLNHHKVGLMRFIDDARIPIDNNLTERGYLWPAIGRRAFLGSKSARGTRVAAIFYSLTESARRNGLDPKAYLRVARDAALAGCAVPLPHEIVAFFP